MICVCVQKVGSVRVCAEGDDDRKGVDRGDRIFSSLQESLKPAAASRVRCF